MISLEGVTYRYAGSPRAALRDISIDFASGEVVGVAGANGAGKSTLCLVAAGLAPRVVGGSLAGRVAVDGTPLGEMDPGDVAARVGIGFESATTQLTGVAGTVYEEVAFGPSNLGLPPAEIVERTDSALEALTIGDLAQRDPAQLSGGQQQLVALAGLLAMGPGHLVLDEPTAQLDPHGTRLVGDALERLAARGIGIVLCEHRTDLLLRLCSRVVVLDAGAVAIDGPAGAALADERLAELGVAEPSAVRLDGLLRSAGMALPA